MKKCILVGGGGHAKVMLDAIEAEGVLEPVGFVDPDPKSPLSTLIPYLGTDAELPKLLSSGIRSCVVSVGSLPSTNLREKLTRELQKMKFTIESVIHPTAVISRSAKIGAGIQVSAGAVINPGTVIEEGVIVNTGARIDHDCVIDSFANVAPGAIVCGGVTVGARTYIGAGSVIIQSISIAPDVVIGAGAVVSSSIESAGTYVGVPAKPIRRLLEDIS